MLVKLYYYKQFYKALYKITCYKNKACVKVIFKIVIFFIKIFYFFDVVKVRSEIHEQGRIQHAATRWQK